MNLRVDLILEDEQRSGSILNVKSATRIFGIVLPVGALLGIAWFIMSAMGVDGELKNLEAKWKIDEPKKKEVLALEKQVKRNKEVLAEFEGWAKSHIDWHNEIIVLMKNAPAPVQLTSLSTRERIELVDEIPARIFTVTLNGKTSGKNADEAESNVQTLRRSMAEASHVDAEVVSFGKNSEGPGEFDRIFKIECNFEPRPFK